MFLRFIKLKEKISIVYFLIHIITSLFIRERAGRYGIRINESIAGLMKMAVSDEMICFTYSAESYAKANKAGFISNEILCF